MEPLRTAIVGVDAHTEGVIDLLSGNERFELVDICDGRAEVLRRYEVEGRSWGLFDDPREMILRSEAQLLIAWLGSVQEGYLQLAVDRGMWLVVRGAGEGLLESVGKLVARVRSSVVGAFMWSPWAFVPSFDSATDWLADQQIQSISVRFSAGAETLDWPNLDNPLVALTYPSVSLVHRWLGLPQAVFCRQCFRPAQDEETPLRYHCKVDMTYADTLVDVCGSLNSGPDRCDVSVHSSGGTIELSRRQAKWYDAGGELITSSEEHDVDAVQRIAYDRNLNAIWQAYQERQRTTEFDLTRHIGVIATLEAAALSTRTGHPEQVSKVADLGDIISLR